MSIVLSASSIKSGDDGVRTHCNGAILCGFGWQKGDAGRSSVRQQPVEVGGFAQPNSLRGQATLWIDGASPDNGEAICYVYWMLSSDMHICYSGLKTV